MVLHFKINQRTRETLAENHTPKETFNTFNACDEVWTGAMPNLNIFVAFAQIFEYARGATHSIGAGSQQPAAAVVHQSRVTVPRARYHNFIIQNTMCVL